MLTVRPARRAGRGRCPKSASAWLRTVEQQMMHVHVRPHAVVSEGMPSRQILRVVNGSQCDPIVRATYGRTRRLHARLGSVTEDVLRQASYPIFTVRPPLDSPIRQRCVDGT